MNGTNAGGLKGQEGFHNYLKMLDEFNMRCKKELEYIPKLKKDFETIIEVVVQNSIHTYDQMEYINQALFQVKHGIHVLKWLKIYGHFLSSFNGVPKQFPLWVDNIDKLTTQL